VLIKAADQTLTLSKLSIWIWQVELDFDQQI